MADRPTGSLVTNIKFDASAACPRWMQFLVEVFGDPALVDYIWRAVGYSLTGDISEQCVFTCHGSGANGKSVFLSLLRALAGEYAFNAPFSTFELGSRPSIPNDLAALVGRRLVTALEINEGVRLNEARLKSLTGGDPTTARFLHGEFFSYQPVGKFWLAVNHRPRVTTIRTVSGVACDWCPSSVASPLTLILRCWTSSMRNCPASWLGQSMVVVNGRHADSNHRRPLPRPPKPTGWNRTRWPGSLKTAVWWVLRSPSERVISFVPYPSRGLVTRD